MDTDVLFRMANRIGDFFEAMPDLDEALAGVASHIAKFWEPRMRRQFLASLDSGADGLGPFAREAVERHRGLIG